MRLGPESALGRDQPIAAVRWQVRSTPDSGRDAAERPVPAEIQPWWRTLGWRVLNQEQTPDTYQRRLDHPSLTGAIQLGSASGSRAESRHVYVGRETRQPWPPASSFEWHHGIRGLAAVVA
jgi:hypothetical protein